MTADQCAEYEAFRVREGDRTYRIHKVGVKSITKLLNARCDFVKHNTLQASI